LPVVVNGDRQTLKGNTHRLCTLLFIVGISLETGGHATATIKCAPQCYFFTLFTGENH